jgi:cytochrome P450
VLNQLLVKHSVHNLPSEKMLNEMLNEPLGQLAHRATVQRLMEVLTPVMITWLLVLFVAGYAAHLLLLATNQHPLGKVLCGKKTLPFAPVTLLQTAKMTASKDLPWATLDLVKRAGAVNFRLPIPVPNGFYMIGDYKLARDILLAHTSDKPSGVHRQLHLWKSKGDMFVSPSTFHWRMVRKSVSFAFSKREVNRMEEVCKNRLRHMTENKVDLLSLDGGTFYPCTELKRLTYETLCEAAFEYVPEESEFEEITRTLDQITTAMRHETQVSAG